MKIVVLIPMVNRQPWTDMKVTQKNTWGLNLPKDFIVLYYHGARNTRKSESIKSEFRELLRFGKTSTIQRILDTGLNFSLSRQVPESYWEGDELHVDTYDTLGYLGFRTIVALDEVLKKFEFDFVFRSNTSSYINPTRLQNLLELKQSQMDYGGWVESGQKFWGWDFVNGAGIVLSKIAVLKILEKRSTFNHRYLDDVAIGRVFKDIGIYPVHISRPMLSEPSDVAKLSDAEIRSHHFRIRTTSKPRMDTTILKMLHERILALN